MWRLEPNGPEHPRDKTIKKCDNTFPKSLNIHSNLWSFSISTVSRATVSLCILRNSHGVFKIEKTSFSVRVPTSIGVHSVVEIGIVPIQDLLLQSGCPQQNVGLNARGLSVLQYLKGSRRSSVLEIDRRCLFALLFPSVYYHLVPSCVQGSCVPARETIATDLTSSRHNCRHHPWRYASATCLSNVSPCKKPEMPRPLQHGSRCLRAQCSQKILTTWPRWLGELSTTWILLISFEHKLTNSLMFCIFSTFQSPKHLRITSSRRSFYRLAKHQIYQI